MAVSGVAVFGGYLAYLARRAPAPHFRVFRALFGVFLVPAPTNGQPVCSVLAGPSYWCGTGGRHGTRFGTLAILVKAFKCASGELETDV